MNTIDELRAEHAKQLATLSAELALAESMPEAPHRVMLAGKRAPWVTHKARTIAEAAGYLKLYAERAKLVNIEHAKGTFTHLCPASDRGTRYAGDEVIGDYAAILRVHQGEGFGPSVNLTFYAEVAGKLVRVNVDIEPERYSGTHHWRLGARVVEHRHSRTDRLDSRTFHPNDALNGYADKVVSFGGGDSGPVKTSADISYLFVADDGEACSQFTHLLAQLQSMADEFDAKPQA